MKPDDKDKLNNCIDILESTDLGLSLVWLWTWYEVKSILKDEDWAPLVSEDEAWEALAKAVESGRGFSLQYGAEQLYEEVVDWMIQNELIKDNYEEEEDNGDD